MDGLPVKLCECGCGKPAPISRKTDSRRGVKKGESFRFIYGHYGLRRASNGKRLKCSKCKKWKLRDDFKNCKEMVLGKRSWCRSCIGEYYRTSKVVQKWILAHPKEVKLIRKNYHKRCVQELRKRYLKKLIRRNTGLSRREITEEMIDLKREQLMMQRLIKSIIKEDEDGTIDTGSR